MADVTVYLLCGGPGYKTTVWYSDAVDRAIMEESDNPTKVVEKLKYLARAGFWDLRGSESAPVRSEQGKGNNVYRVWHKRGSTFRMFGFFEGMNEFILIDGFKRGGDYNGGHWKRIFRVGEVRDNKSYIKQLRKPQ